MRYAASPWDFRTHPAGDLLGRISAAEPKHACPFHLYCILALWFPLELPRKGSAKGGGICDARVEVHPVNWSTLEVQNPETQTHFGHSGGRDTCTAFHWESPTKENFTHGFFFSLLESRAVPAQVSFWDSSPIPCALSREYCFLIPHTACVK